jgi:NRE family putative nickel resistance protein-like MFS transporter
MKPAESAATRRLFGNRTFALLFSAQIISLAGSGASTVGLALFAHLMIGGPSAAVVIGNALMLRILAFLLFSQPAGMLADRFDRKQIMVAADIARFVLMALFPFINAVWQIYVLIFVINAVTAFFTPTYESTIPQVVGSRDYVKALSLSRVAVDVEAVAAPAIAGALVAVLGLKWVFWFDAATYLVSALLVSFATVPRANKSVPPFALRDLARDLTFGIRLILKQQPLRRAVLLSFAEATAGAAAIVSTVIYVQDVLAHGETAFALAMAGLGLGSTVAALTLGAATGRYEAVADNRKELHGRRHRWAEIALVSGGTLSSAVLLPGALQPPILVFALLWFLNGAGQALIAIPSSMLLAEHTAENERGRAYAAHFALTHAFWLISYPAVGYGTSSFGAPMTFTIAGVICLLTTILVFVSRRPIADHEHAVKRAL